MKPPADSDNDTDKIVDFGKQRRALRRKRAAALRKAILEERKVRVAFRNAALEIAARIIVREVKDPRFFADLCREAKMTRFEQAINYEV